MLHQFIDIHLRIEGIRFHLACEMDELSSHIFLRQDMSMIFDIGRRSHLIGKFHNIWSASHLIECTLMPKFLGNSKQVDRLFTHIHILNSLINLLMTRVIKSLRTQQLRYHGEGILVHHQGTKDHLLHIDSLRRQMSITIIDWRLSTTPSCLLFWHIFLNI